MLSLGQIGLATSQFSLRFSRGGDIRDRPNKFDAIRFTSHGVSHGMDMFYRTIGRQQPVLMVKISSFGGSSDDGLLRSSAIVWMYALDDQFKGRFCRLII